jgi:hypothetical protein
LGIGPEEEEERERELEGEKQIDGWFYEYSVRELKVLKTGFKRSM